MATVRVYVGLDYHDSGVQVCILAADRRMLANVACPNDAAGLAALVRPHGDQVFAAIEEGGAELAGTQQRTVPHGDRPLERTRAL